jgi:hypothetical protein
MRNYRQPVIVMPKQNPLPIILFMAGLFLVFQFQNKSWPFEETQPTPPSPVIDETEDEQTKPDSKVAWVIVVDESKGRPASRQLVLNDYKFWFEELPKLGARHRWYDKDDVAAQTFILRAKADGIEPPLAMTVSANGSVGDVIKFPDSVGPIRELLK